MMGEMAAGLPSRLGDICGSGEEAVRGIEQLGQQGGKVGCWVGVLGEVLCFEELLSGLWDRTDSGEDRKTRED
jgi:hypothetical protein